MFTPRNNHFIFTRALLGLLVAGAAALPHGSGQAAEMRNVGPAPAPRATATASPVSSAQLPSILPRMLGVDAESGFTVKSSDPLPNNQGEAVRLDQVFRGVPIWGQQVVVQVSPSGQIAYMGGTAVFDVGAGAPAAAASLAQDRAMQIAKDDTLTKSLAPRTLNYINEESGLVYYLTKSGELKLTYRVSFYTDLLDASGSPKPTRPVYFIDANTGETVYSYENIQHAALGTGPGGNLKTGQWTWGSGAAFPKFQVQQNASTCTLDDGATVYSEDLNHTTTGTQTPYSFTCFNNTYQTINGGYSPLNDAQSFGYALYQMYQTWYSQPPITQKLWLRVHYGTAYENAFWNGTSMAFGDGATTFHPLVGMDIMGHEVSHGFTEQHSNLTYANQSGGINEAYSDMAGEALEYFYSQTYGAPFPRTMPDYLVGAEIFKAANQALRYMCTPRDDTYSIDNAFAYGSGLDVHYSSGVYNKAFCVLAKTAGWGPKKAFDVFRLANNSYWTPSTDFASGATAVVQAATTLGYSTVDVTAAFQAVGLFGAANPYTPIASGSLSSTSLTQTGRTTRSGIPATCATTKAYPGETSTGTTYRYTTQQYTHVGAPRCVTFWLGTGGTCGNNALLSIYSGAYNPASRPTNYLADPGSSGEGPWTSVSMTSGQTVTLVVSAATTSLNCSFIVFSDEPAPKAHDFSGDLKSDILWRNTSGDVGIWLMNGGAYTPAGVAPGVTSNWSIVGQRDVSGDGKADLLWLNTAGDFGYWAMNGAAYTPVALGNVGTSWSVIGTGDFDGDSRSDILWRNTSGDVGIWFMTGATSYTPVGYGNPGASWSVIGTGDFDGNGKRDILWRNTSGETGIWFMNGTSVTPVSLGIVPNVWSVAGLGDFDGDGKTDIMWRNTSNDIGYWAMNGASYTPVYLGNVGPSWGIASVGDYDGNGKSDLLWRSTTNDIGVWFMTGPTAYTPIGFGNVGPTWLVQNAASN